MGAIIMFLAFLVPGWIVFLTVRALRREKAGNAWWVALALLTLGGIITGIWAGFMSEYHVGSKLRFAGFPFPMAVFQLEDDRWVDYVHEGVIMLAIGSADVLVITLCCVLPISATFYVRRLLFKRRASS